MNNRVVELIFKSVVQGKEEVRQLREEIERLKRTKVETTEANKKFGDSITGQLVKFEALHVAAIGYTKALRDLGVETAKYAARTETLRVVMDNLAKVNGINVDAARFYARSVRDMGITTQESISVINRMIFAQIDLKKSTDLARLAQDAAVIAGKNSSEALDGIIHGIVTRQPEVLRTYGIIVDFETRYAQAARELGRELTATEKVQIALNSVLERGAQITGSYETAMLTAGKQMTSLQRQFDEARAAVGEGLVPALSIAVAKLAELAKFIEKNPDLFSNLILAAGGASAGAVAGASIGGPYGAAIGGALGAAGAIIMRPDPVETKLALARSGIASIQAKREQLQDALEDRSLTAAQRASLVAQYQGTNEALKTIRNTFTDSIAQVWIARGGRTAARRGWNTADTFDLGPAGIVTPEDLMDALARRTIPPNLANAITQNPGGGAPPATRNQPKPVTLPFEPNSIFSLPGYYMMGSTAGVYPGFRAAQQSIGMFEAMNRPNLNPLDDASYFATMGLPVRGSSPILPTIDTSGLQMRQAMLETQSKLLSLAGREVEAARTMLQMRQEGARTDIESAQARMDFEVQIAQIRARQINDFAQGVGRAYDAAISGGAGGLRSFFASQITGFGRAVAVNAGREGFGAFGGRLAGLIPGQGTPENPSLLGRLLQGTPLGLDPTKGLETATAINTQVTAQNTAAIQNLTAFVGGSSISGGGASSIIGGGLGVAGLFTGGGGVANNSALANAAAGRAPGGTQILPANPLGNPRGGGFGLGRAVGVAGAAAGAGFGIYAGIQQGGARGALTGLGAAGAGAAAILPLLGLAGGPIGGLIALGAGIGAMLMPDPKKSYARRLESYLNSRRYDEPDSIERTVDSWGREVDLDIAGGIRATKARNVTINQIQISALDAQSIIDRAEDIGFAMQRAAEIGHPAVDTLKSAMFPS